MMGAPLPLNHQYGAGGVTDHLLGDAAHKQSFQAGPAMGTHDDGICLLFACHVYDRLPRLCFSDKGLHPDP